MDFGPYKIETINDNTRPYYAKRYATQHNIIQLIDFLVPDEMGLMSTRDGALRHTMGMRGNYVCLLACALNVRVCVYTAKNFLLSSIFRPGNGCLKIANSTVECGFFSRISRKYK